MLKKVLANPIIAFFVFTFVIIAILYIVSPESFSPSQYARVKDTIDCKTEKISPGLLDTRLADASVKKLIISMHEEPNEQTISEFREHQVTIFPESWIFDYVIGEAPAEALCFLAEDQRVSYIDVAP